MRSFRQVRTLLFLTGMLLAAGWLAPVRADEMRAPSPDADAARLVEEVLRKAGGNDGESLGAWSRSIVDRALERAGETARQTVPGSGSGAYRGRLRPFRPNAMRGALPGMRRVAAARRNPDLHQPVGACRKLAAMGARRGPERGAAGAARRRRWRPARNREADRRTSRRRGGRGRHRPAPVPPVRRRARSRRRRGAGRRAALPEPGLRGRSRTAPRPGDREHRPGGGAGSRCGRGGRRAAASPAAISNA